MLYTIALISIVSFTPVVLTGCASRTKTQTTTQTGTAAAVVPASSTTVVEKETVIKDDNPNIISRTVNIAGEILALPFRLVAGLFELIF